jgi:hypothetical protein
MLILAVVVKDELMKLEDVTTGLTMYMFNRLLPPQYSLAFALQTREHPLIDSSVLV